MSYSFVMHGGNDAEWLTEEHSVTPHNDVE